MTDELFTELDSVMTPAKNLHKHCFQHLEEQITRTKTIKCNTCTFLFYCYKNVEIRGNTEKQIIMRTYDLSVERLTLYRRSVVIPSTEEDICFIYVF